MQSSNQIITTNIQFFTGRMPFLSPNQQCQSTEGKISQPMDLLTPNSPGGLWPLIAPGNLGRELPCLSSAHWCQYPLVSNAFKKIQIKVTLPIICTPPFINAHLTGSKIKTGKKITLHVASSNKLCGRLPKYVPAPCELDLLTLKVVSESPVTWATSVRILVFLGLARPLCSRLRPNVRYRQTSDVRQHHRLMPPPRGTGA